MDSLFVEWEMYQDFFSLIAQVVHERAQIEGLNLVVTGNRNLMEYLSSFFDIRQGISFQCLDNRNFHAKLKTASVFITTCGIEAAYEAFHYRVPTVFLPPINSTQLYQLMALKGKGFPVVVSDKIINHFLTIISKRSDYHDETLHIARMFKKIFSNNATKAELYKIGNYIKQILYEPQYSDNLINRQENFSKRAPYRWQDVFFLENGSSNL